MLNATLSHSAKELESKLMQDNHNLVENFNFTNYYDHDNNNYTLDETNTNTNTNTSFRSDENTNNQSDLKEYFYINKNSSPNLKFADFKASSISPISDTNLGLDLKTKLKYEINNGQYNGDLVSDFALLSGDCKLNDLKVEPLTASLPGEIFHCEFCNKVAQRSQFKGSRFCSKICVGRFAVR